MRKRQPRIWQGTRAAARRSTLLAATLAAVAGCWAAPAKAQLDDDCIVSLLNRSAPVEPDGTWVLPNVPANFGRVRARATCITDGVTRCGQSDFFIVPVNGVIRISEIVFDAPEPVPASLALSASVRVLSSVGESVQLTAVVTYPDGTTADVSSAASGTNYTISNPRVATVDDNGLISAQASGFVLVSATHEGSLAVLGLSVILSGDSDGDGLPDDFELANGLDPNNRSDAFTDPDSDNLSVLDEFLAGLDPFDPDTDDDRLPDGEEVNRHGTNPLLFDTDGDLVSDGLEVFAASDPLDRNSVNLAPILESMTINPPSFTLVFNTAIGEASRRLRVPARLVDGTELDIAGAPYGTAYTSSDLTVASFGLEPGRVFAGQDGTATVTATNGGFSAATAVTVESFSPTALSFIRIPGFANGVAADADHAYVAAGARGLYVVDVRDPSAPFIAGSVETPGNANDVRVEGGFAYVADGSRGLQVIDIGDPGRPRIAATIDTPGNATDLAVAGGRVFVADGSAGLQIIDVADPSAPTLLGSVDTPGNARGIDISGDLVVIADDRAGVHVVDASDPAAPFIAGSTHTRPNAVSLAADVVVRERLAYVADGSANLGGLRVVDFRVPSTPVVVGSTDNRFGLVGVALAGDLVLTADYFFANAVPIFNVATETPAFSAVLDFSGAPSFRDDNGNGVAVRDDLVFLVGTRWTIADNGAFGDSGLHIGRYLKLQDNEGVAPEVALTAPADGDSARERSLVTVEAEATDDIRVAAVEFLLDGEVIHQDFSAPFQYTFRVPEGNPILTLGARALDLGGTTGLAENITLNVIPDADPTVSFLSPTAGSRFTEGVTIPIAAEATDDVAVTSVEFLVDGVTRQVLAGPPFRFDFTIPLGTREFRVAAVATDNVGQTATAGPVVVEVDDDRPPLAAVIQPVEGTEVVAGGRLRVVVGADDDVAVERVRLLVGGAPSGDDFQAPYEFEIDVPASTGPLSLGAVAFDSLGQEGVAPELGVSVVPDPLTFAFGSVATEAGEIVAGASVTCAGVGGQSDAEGFFSIPNVPTASGEVSCTATFVDVRGVALTGTSASVPPVPAGVTDVGEVTIVESRFIDDLGTLLNLGDDDSAAVSLPFSFPFFGQSHGTAFVNSNGNLTFDTSSPRDWTEDRDEFVSGLRDLDGRNVGPAIAAFWDEPNDDFATAFPLQMGNVVHGTISAASDRQAMNVFVNDQLAGKLVVTWNRVPEFPSIGSNTIQAILFEDGRIQFTYAGLTSDDAIVGVSPSHGGDFLEADFSRDAPFSATGAIAVFEEFDGPNGPDGTGEDPPGTHPFDLDGQFLVFSPNASGGYDVSLGGSGSGTPLAALRFKTLSGGPAGTVEALVIAAVEMGTELEAIVTSSGDPSYQARLTVMAGDVFRLEGVPVGGVNVRVYAGSELVAHGAGVLRAEEKALEIELRPAAEKPKEASE